MEYVFIDFEMNQIDNAAQNEFKICKNEIIEIGAVKLDDTYKEIDSFKTYVRPVVLPLNNRIVKLTGITTEMVEDAPEFKSAIDSFIEWCGDADVIYAWSENDLRQFNKERRIKNYTHDRVNVVVSRWKDFQKEFAKLLGTRRRLALSDAVFYLGEDFQGKEHDALWDARNTAEVFVLSKDKEKFEKVMAPIMEVYKPKQTMTYSLGDIFKNINIQE